MSIKYEEFTFTVSAEGWPPLRLPEWKNGCGHPLSPVSTTLSVYAPEWHLITRGPCAEGCAPGVAMQAILTGREGGLPVLAKGYPDEAVEFIVARLDMVGSALPRPIRGDRGPGPEELGLIFALFGGDEDWSLSTMFGLSVDACQELTLVGVTDFGSFSAYWERDDQGWSPKSVSASQSTADGGSLIVSLDMQGNRVKSRAFRGGSGPHVPVPGWMDSFVRIFGVRDVEIDDGDR